MSIFDTIKNDLKSDEGFRSHVYQDHLGYFTIGYGRMVDKRKRGGITKEEAEMLLENDMATVWNELENGLSFWPRLPLNVKRALVNMGFQMGVPTVLRFKKTLKHLQNGQWERAADEALDSKWASQTPNRAKRVTDWIRWV